MEDIMTEKSSSGMEEGQKLMTQLIEAKKSQSKVAVFCMLERFLRLRWQFGKSLIFSLLYDMKGNAANAISTFTPQDIARRLRPLISELEVINSGGPANFLANLEKSYLAILQASSHTDTVVSLIECINSIEELQKAINSVFYQWQGDKGKDGEQGEISSSDPGAILDHILEILGETKATSVIGQLARAESVFLEQTSSKAFEALGLGSFLHFCVKHEPSIVSILNNNFEPEPSIASSESPRKHLSLFLTKVIADMRDKNVNLEFALDYFNITAEKLGFNSQESFDQFIAQLASSDNIVHENTIPILHSALLGWNSDNKLAQGYLTLDRITLENIALGVLDRAPYAVDLKDWMMWTEIFEPSIGELDTFFSNKRLGNVIEIQQGKFLKYDPNTNHTPVLIDPLSKTPILHGSKVTGWILGLLVSQGIQQMPIEHIKESIFAQLKQVNEDAAFQFILDALESLPHLLLHKLGFDIFVEPYYQLYSTDTIHRGFLRQCRTYSQRRLLHQIGILNNIELWAQDFTLFNSDLTLFYSCPSENKLTIVEESKVHPSENTMEVIQTVGTLPVSVEIEPTEIESGSIIEDDENPTEVYNRILYKFGCTLDASLSTEGQAALGQLRQLATRSIKGLASELYAEDIHFLLELIQNADDNTYDSSVVPSYHISLSSNKITLTNNEVGFKAKNVEAICDIGQSTKKNKTGYIGRKGIGFKSVFKVSNNPIVHSRQYHFEFDLSRKDDLGYIIPQEVDTPLNWNRTVGKTMIILPIADTSQIATMQKRMNEIHSSLLLFLHRLRTLILHDSIKGETLTMRRYDGEDQNIVVIEQSYLPSRISLSSLIFLYCFYDSTQVTRTNKYLITSKELKTRSKERGNEEAITEISLAFPLYDLASMPETLPIQQVFAFLPLRSYGFKFVIQADWTTTSSRESVDAASSWNQWLRMELSSLFCSSALSFVERAKNAKAEKGDFVDEEVDEEEFLEDEQPSKKNRNKNKKNRGKPTKQTLSAYWINLFLSFIPLTGQISDFFASAANDMLKSIRNIPFIPVIDGHYVCPHQAIYFPMSLSASIEVIKKTQKILVGQGLYLVHNEIYISEPIAKEIGMRQLDGTTLCELLSVANKDCLDFEWLAWVLNQLSREPKLATLKLKLQNISFIPLASREITSISQGDVYELASSKGGNLYSKMVQQVERVIHPDLIEKLSNYPEAKTVLRRIGIVPLDGHTFIEKYVLHKLTDESQCDCSTAVDLLSFAMQHTNSNCSDCQRLTSAKSGALWLTEELKKSRKSLKLATKEGKVEKLSNVQFHIPPCYFPSFQQSIHPCNWDSPTLTHLMQNWLYISEEYSKNPDISSDQWLQLFLSLGMWSFVEIQQVQRCIPISRHEDWINGDYDVDTERVNEEATLSFTDYTSPIFLAMIQYSTPELFKWILLQWNHYSQFFVCSNFSSPSQSSSNLSSIYSSFLLQLKKSPWVNINGTRYTPTDIITSNSKLSEILEGIVPTLDTECSPEVRATLGLIHDKISLSSLLHCFNNLQTLSNFTISTSKMSIVYEFIRTSLLPTSTDEEMELMKNTKLFFVPKHPAEREYSSSKRNENTWEFNTEQKVSGDFYYPHDCISEDSGNVIDSARKTTFNADAIKMIQKASHSRCLQLYYGPTCKRWKTLFLREKCGFDDYLPIWRESVKLSSFAPVFRIINSLAYCKTEEEDEENIAERIKQVLMNEPLLPTTDKNKWTTLSEYVFVSNNAENDCSDFPDAKQLMLEPPKQYNIIIKHCTENSKKFFLEVLNIPSLESVIFKSIGTTQSRIEKVESVASVMLTFYAIQLWSLSEKDSIGQQLKQLLQNITQVTFAKAVAITPTIKLNTEKEIRSVKTETVNATIDDNKSVVYLVYPVTKDAIMDLVEIITQNVITKNKVVRTISQALENAHLANIKTLHALYKGVATHFQIDSPAEPWITASVIAPQEESPPTTPIIDVVTEKALKSMEESRVRAIERGNNNKVSSGLHFGLKGEAPDSASKEKSDKEQKRTTFDIIKEDREKSSNHVPSLSLPVLDENKNVNSVPLNNDALAPSWELIVSDIPINPSNIDPNLQTTEGTRIVGRMGEEYVVQLLNKNTDYRDVNWVNQESEQFLPFDISAEFFNKEQNCWQKLKCIEVKTSGTSATVFPISIQELMMCYNEKERVQIFCVLLHTSNVSYVPKCWFISNPGKHFGGNIKLFFGFEK